MSKESVKICPICNKEFKTGNANTKYCSAVCKEQGRIEYRKQWELDNNYKESQRIRMRKARERQAEELRSARLSLTEEQKRISIEGLNERLSKATERRKADAENGVTFSALVLALLEHGNASPEYWELFKQYELEQTKNTPCNVAINGISIHNADFPLLASTTVSEQGQILKTSHRTE